MSKKLFVGCRVRILRSHFYPRLAGCEGRVVGRPENSGVLGNSEWLVAPDIWGSEVEPPGWGEAAGFGRFAPNSNQLEPITLHKPSQYSFHELMDKCRAGEVEHV